jgi:hypothetical protein
VGAAQNKKGKHNPGKAEGSSAVLAYVLSGLACWRALARNVDDPEQL